MRLVCLCARGAVGCRGSVSRSLGCVWGFSRPSPDQRPRPPVTGVGEPLAAHVGDRGTAGGPVDLIDPHLKTAAGLSFGTPPAPHGGPPHRASPSQNPEDKNPMGVSGGPLSAPR